MTNEQPTHREDQSTSSSGETESDRPAPKELTPAAKRALAEAEARRRAKHDGGQPAPEIGGQDGPDPVRYGDWEKNGIASDF